MKVEIPLKTTRGLNDRVSHWSERYRQVEKEKEAVGWFLRARAVDKPQLPCTVLMTRRTPSPRPLDDDNLRGSLKAVRDAVAIWLGVDDGNYGRVSFEYAQQTSMPWGVVIELRSRQ